jgi:divalent metal cation (Fe/Co/Zn/Cd) transporter
LETEEAEDAPTDRGGALRTSPTTVRPIRVPIAIKERSKLLGTALRLSYFTIGWNSLVGGFALVVSVLDESPVLAGLALNALLDSSASVVLTWRFVRERHDPIAAERLERRAQYGVAAAMIVVAAYVGFQAVGVLARGSHPEASVFGALVAIGSLLVLPWLGRAKLRVAAGLASPALRGDAILTLASAALAGTTLAALALNAGLDWWWADPAVALLIAGGLALEGTRIVTRHRFG